MEAPKNEPQQSPASFNLFITLVFLVGFAVAAITKQGLLFFVSGSIFALVLFVFFYFYKIILDLLDRVDSLEKENEILRQQREEK